MSSVPSNVLEENPRDLAREEEPRDDETKSPIVNDDEKFPKSIGLLLVTDDQSLRRMENLRTGFSYSGRTFENGDRAIAYLIKNKHEFDLVIWDLHGLETVINTIDKEMDLPVVIVSDDHSKETVMKFLKYGACDFLVKPVSKEVISVLWKYVYRKKMSKSGYGSVESADQSNEGSKNVFKDTGEQNKKPRVDWNDELHNTFLKAIAKKAVPKTILECMEEDMGVQGLTREHVASHLQNYRQSLEKNSGVPNETRQDSIRRNAGPSTSSLIEVPISSYMTNPFANVPSFQLQQPQQHYEPKPLLDSSFNLHAREPYFTYDQAIARALIQFPSTSYLTMNNSSYMTNPLADLPYTDSFHQPLQQQQQQYGDSFLQLPTVITTQDTAHVSSAMENLIPVTNQNLPLIDLNEPPPADNLDPPA